MNGLLARPRVGVLAVQGAFVEHERALEAAGADTVQVRGPGDLARVDAAVLPGGESTTLGLVAEESGLLDALRAGDTPVEAVFIRAPWIEEAGPGVEVLASHSGHGVAARQGDLMVTAFHPELSDERRFHDWLVTRARERRARTAGTGRRQHDVRAQ